MSCVRFKQRLLRRLTCLPARQEVRYLVAGGCNTLFGYGVYALLNWQLAERLPLGYMAAAVLSNVCAITFSYLTYKFFVFRTRGNYVREYLRCYLVYGGMALLGLALLPLFVEGFGINSYLAPILTMPVTILASYFGHRDFSFRPTALSTGEPSSLLCQQESPPPTPNGIAGTPAAGDSRPRKRQCRTRNAWDIRLGSRLMQWCAVAVLLLLYWVMAVSATREKCTTFDEPLHLTAGYSQLITGDYRLLPGQGSLPQKWAALPLLWLRPTFPPTTGNRDWQESSHFGLGNSFFYKLGNDPAALLLAGRMMIAILGAALALTVFLWARELWGGPGAFVSLLLAVFCPALLAHGALITCDLAATLFFVLAVWSYWRLLDRVSYPRVLVCALALAGLCLAKTSWILVLPMLALLFLLRLLLPPPRNPAFPERSSSARTKELRNLAVANIACGALVAALLWGYYGFRFAASPVSPDEVAPLATAWDTYLKDGTLPIQAIGAARTLRLLPEAWLFGVVYMAKAVAQKPAFMNGQYSTIGFTGFFPYAFLVKTPLALFGLLTLAGYAFWRIRPAAATPIAAFQPDSAAARLRQTLPIWVLLVVYWAAAVTSPINIGHRHILVTYPALYILAGACGWWFSRQRWPLALATSILLLLFATSSVSSRPDYLAYFNPLAGGPKHAYKHLVDSSLDWGQELPRLKNWLERHRQPDDPVYLAYFGSGDPAYHGIQATLFPVLADSDLSLPVPIGGGLYCISATRLQGLYGFAPGPWSVAYEQTYQNLRQALAKFSRSDSSPQTPGQRQSPPDPSAPRSLMFQVFNELRLARLCTVLRRREPDAQIGYSILIYRLSDAQVREALDGPPVELVPDSPLGSDNPP